jgi:type II secretory pathway pseudopilin PulG
MVELMIVIAVVGILASIAIPGYQKMTARSHRSEMYTSLSKMRLYFKNIHDNQGTFSTPQTLPAGGVSDVNPSPSVQTGQPANWLPNAHGWADVTGTPEGAVRMRYWYTMGTAVSELVHDVTFQVCGSFAGFGPPTITCNGLATGNYVYTEVFHGNGTSDIVESPEF